MGKKLMYSRTKTGSSNIGLVFMRKLSSLTEDSVGDNDVSD